MTKYLHEVNIGEIIRQFLKDRGDPVARSAPTGMVIANGPGKATKHSTIRLVRISFAVTVFTYHESMNRRYLHATCANF